MDPDSYNVYTRNNIAYHGESLSAAGVWHFNRSRTKEREREKEKERDGSPRIRVFI